MRTISGSLRSIPLSWLPLIRNIARIRPETSTEMSQIVQV